MDRGPPNIGIENGSDDSETDSMADYFNGRKMKRSYGNFSLGEGVNVGGINRFVVNPENAFFHGDENPRSKRRRLDLFEAVNAKRRLEEAKLSEKLKIAPNGRVILDGSQRIQLNSNIQTENVNNLKYQTSVAESIHSRRDLLSRHRAPFPSPSSTTGTLLNSEAPGLDGSLSLLQRDILLRAPMHDYAHHNMRLSGGTCLQKGNPGSATFAAGTLSNTDFTTNYLTGGHNNLTRRLLALDIEQRLASSHASTSGPTGGMHPINANLEAILHSRQSTPSSFALENFCQRGLDPSLLNRDALLLRRQELANRLECPLRASLNSLLHDPTQYPLFHHASNLTESALFGNRESVSRWQLSFQSGLDQPHLNMQIFPTGTTTAPSTATTIAQRYRALRLDNNIDSGNERNDFTPQSSSYVSRPRSMKLSSEERAGISPLPPCEEGPLPHFSKRRCVPLATDEDENWLSEFLCFIRSELVEVFRASNDDVASRINSKKVVFRQVGIRCRYCAHLTHGERASRSSSFPSSIDRIYQSLTMMIRDHFVRCTGLPDNLRARFTELRSHSTQGATDSKRYWIESAKRLGMVDTRPNQGIMVTEETQASAHACSPAATRASSPESKANEKRRAQIMIVMNEDKPLVSEYIYYLLTQVEKVCLTESERVGNRKSMELGMPGFGCKHCCASDRKGLCRFFPARRRTLPAKIKDLSDHLRRCTMCPMEVKEKLLQYRSENLDLEPTEDSNKHFFDRVWNRLHSQEKNQCQGHNNDL